MKKLNLILAKLGFFIFFVFNPFVQADELISKNISVIDGDTILLENKKIRFSGIDAPESFFRGKKMSTFDERQKGFEKKFAHDEEKEFKISARRNKYLGEWASNIMGNDEHQTKEYIQSVIKADFAEAGDEDVFRKIKSDLKNFNISDEDIRSKMNEMNEKAKSDFS